MNDAPSNYEQLLRKAERIGFLIAGHLANSLSEAESDELDEWICASDENLALFERLTNEENVQTGIEEYLRLERGKAEAYSRLQRKLKER